MFCWSCCAAWHKAAHRAQPKLALALSQIWSDASFVLAFLAPGIASRLSSTTVITCLALGLLQASADEQAMYKFMISCGHSSGTLQHGRMDCLHLRSFPQRSLRTCQLYAGMNVQCHTPEEWTASVVCKSVALKETSGMLQLSSLTS